MPELPEVETVCRGLEGPLVGHRLIKIIQRRADLRWPLPENFAQRLEGRRIQRLHRRAKFILADLDDGWVWMTHLGMSGRMYIHQEQAPVPGKHDHILLETDAGHTIVYQDHRRFGMMDLVPAAELDEHRLLRDIGPEPLGNQFDGPSLSLALSGRRTPIKSALLDQKIVAGLGNIYVCEALFHSGISPRRLAASVAGRRAERLVPAIRDVLMKAIAKGGSTLRDYVQASGELGYFQHEFAVYGREGEPCMRCNQPIKRLVQAGRSTFFCSSCQR
ncbi:MAG: bifunctional DNA-formamidopyrimidine glycosylase/DNA-(apurinic or apyrimidinic site) lyase [Rhodospirillaceae bacterium]|jgi:formamidopyrimidine-DNA glycosylase|nr:bifunctional DNA-formamidopyrimidine glycosylase/DNA-(apurinic or apyrimidinic site) lyase [Rhodospirillaceae bacterium]MBT4489742.1 bifunctional DNA-formamidopyrimidine glycosylase/DNA-(apurinic or apyrimidinic site) lyase [Rhodospirillaceae bacterium]MBT4687026.1 bifunctional DNA-formamidopyrimidine glycosylase/DNA-(apurinic or apyrimidinic site) lyase [Rhodospirillaceae bacterium]MBT5881589.1 bifunctional DNA-formamidopyrimidine glycosylase/DNA-(apurinic or apyrimidinic site) lyase [Rhodos